MLFSIIPHLIIGIVFFVVDYFGVDIKLPAEKWWILGFFVLLTIYYQRLMMMGFRNKREHLVQFAIVYKVSKLILSLIFIGYMLLRGIGQPFRFVIAFFVLYLFYTCFEVLEFNRKLRQN